MSVDLGAADGASPHVSEKVESPVLERRLDPLVEARLAEVVQRLRASWLAGPALLWGEIYPIRDVARDEFDKRVATTLVTGFFQFSQFLAGFEVLVLHLEHRGVVSEQSLLGLQKLIVDPSNPLGNQIEVPHA